MQKHSPNIKEMKKLSYLLLIAFSWLFCQCVNRHDDDDMGKDYPSRKTFAVIDNCMSFMNTDPQKAHCMLDSLAQENLMTKQRCDYYHAMVIYSGENNIDSALIICERLLEKGEFGDDRYLEEEICVLASNITSSSNRHLETLKYANRGIAICHGDETMRDDEASLMARVGEAEQSLGRLEAACQTYDRARELLSENKSFGGLIAFISLQKKQAGLYSEEKEYDKVIGICHEVLELVERFDRDPSFVNQRPETMQESSYATHDFADFYQCQMYGEIARTYRLKIEDGLSADAEADADSVKLYIEKWGSTLGSHSPSSIAPVLRELLFAGKKKEFYDALPVVEDMFKGDSLTSEYVDYLTLVATDASDCGDLKKSNIYLKRALVVSDIIRRREMLSELSEQMSLNMVQEEQLARQDAEYQLTILKITIVLLSMLLAMAIVAVVIILMLIRKMKERKKLLNSTQKDLTQSKVEIKNLARKLENAKIERKYESSKSMFERILIVVEENKMYLDPQLDIVSLADAIGKSRSVVSACINKNTGKPFRQWLLEYRLELYVKMMMENPDASLEDLAMECGYQDQSTFRRQFKLKYGMTPRQYRNKIVGSSRKKGKDADKNESDLVAGESNLIADESDLVVDESDLVADESDLVIDESPLVTDESDLVPDESGAEANQELTPEIKTNE